MVKYYPSARWVVHIEDGIITGWMDRGETRSGWQHGESDLLYLNRCLKDGRLGSDSYYVEATKTETEAVIDELIQYGHDVL